MIAASASYTADVPGNDVDREKLQPGIVVCWCYWLHVFRVGLRKLIPEVCERKVQLPEWHSGMVELRGHKAREYKLLRSIVVVVVVKEKEEKEDD